MSDKCGNCDCADRSQCVKANNYGADIIETDKSFTETIVMEVADGSCKCGTTCSCIDCKCGH